MHLPFRLTAVLLAVLFFAARARAEESPHKKTASPQQVKSLGDNAALSYWQASAMLPQLDEQQQAILDHWETATLDDAAAALLEQCDDALRLVHRGTKIKGCEWGSALEEGPSTLLPHLSKVRQMARLACLRARYRFDKSDNQGAIDDLTATLVLARHTGKEPLIVSCLVQLAIEEMAIRVAAANLLKLSADERALLAERIDALPARGTIKQSIDGEKRWISGWLRSTFLKPDGGVDAKKLLKQMLSDDAETRQLAPALIGKAERVKQRIDELDASYDEMAQLMSLPTGEFEPKWKAFEKRISTSTNPLIRMMLPAVGVARAAELRSMARLALLAAAIDVAGDGEAALARHPDPVGGALFAYQELDDGFVLTSKAIDRRDTKPVTLRAGPTADAKQDAEKPK